MVDGVLDAVRDVLKSSAAGTDSVDGKDLGLRSDADLAGAGSLPGDQGSDLSTVPVASGVEVLFSVRRTADYVAAGKHHTTQVGDAGLDAAVDDRDGDS
jgi:hypothetical protein